MFAKTAVVSMPDFVEVVLVQLPHEAREVRVLEHAGQYVCRETLEVCYYETVTLWAPGDDIGEGVLFQHSINTVSGSEQIKTVKNLLVELLDKVACPVCGVVVLLLHLLL